ncbi:energy transducer TonB [Synergistaceae bacterium OttesenSCG-928-D05]|nr:energy transducer TonB [Synergistaceae bacterium OttesenSCG-928-D05]
MKHAAEKRDWTLAVAFSLALHALIVALIMTVDLSPPKPELSMKLVLRTAPSAPAPSASVPAAVEPAPQKVQQPKPIPKPQPKPTPKPTEIPKPQTTPIAPQSPVSQAQDAAPETPLDTAGTETGTSDASAGAAQSGVGTGNPVDVNTLTITKKVLPEYPSFSRKRKEEGTVRVIITIYGGTVTDARVSESSGHERLDNSALRAVRQWRFNQQEEIRAIVPFIFRLEN